MTREELRAKEKPAQVSLIDFSPKHQFQIRHKDGTLTPMDEPYYEVTKIAENTWQIMSSGDYHYLVAGDEEGVCIDTGYGAGNLRTFCEGLCGKPVHWAINTHSHFDHSANNAYFDLVFMGKDGVDRAAVPYPSFDGITFPRDYAVEIVGDHDVIPLKGRPLEIFCIGDHTSDGIAILDRTQRLLFVGDEIMPGGKMISGSVRKWRDDMEKLMAHRDAFDRLCGGNQLLEGDEVNIFYEAAGMILAGKGTPEAPGKKMPFIKNDDPSLKIYDCQHPHPEDTPGGRPGDKKPKMKPGPKGVLIHRDRRFMYSLDLVNPEDRQ